MRNPIIKISIAILLGLLMIAGAVIGYLRFIQRDHQPATPVRVAYVPSAASQVQLVELMNKSALINGVSITSVDLIKNVRTSTFLQSENREFQSIWDVRLQRRGVPRQVFSSSQKFTENIADVLNSGFSCVRYVDTAGYAQFPEIATVSPWVCSAIIPAGPIQNTGDVIGLINIFLVREPTEEEKVLLKQEVFSISDSIYKRDVTLR